MAYHHTNYHSQHYDDSIRFHCETSETLTHKEQVWCNKWKDQQNCNAIFNGVLLIAFIIAVIWFIRKCNKDFEV